MYSALNNQVISITILPQNGVSQTQLLDGMIHVPHSWLFSPRHLEQIGLVYSPLTWYMDGASQVLDWWHLYLLRDHLTSSGSMLNSLPSQSQNNRKSRDVYWGLCDPVQSLSLRLYLQAFFCTDTGLWGLLPALLSLFTDKTLPSDLAPVSLNP